VLLNLHTAGPPCNGIDNLCNQDLLRGIARIIAGLVEWKKNNTFGMTVFISYGFFRISLVGLLLMPVLRRWASVPSEAPISFLTIWGLFSLVMFIVTLRPSRALQAVFGLPVLLFALLIMGNALGNVTILRIAGIEGVICGLPAMYTGSGRIMDEVNKEQVIRLG